MRPGNHTVLVALTAAVMWFLHEEVAADELSRDELVRRARQELDAIEYKRAYELYERLERTGGATVEMLAEQYQRMAEIAASVRQSQLAVQQYRKLLAIAPEYTLAAGAPPVFEAALAEARERNGPLEALKVNTLVGPDRTSIEIIVARDTLNLISTVALDEHSDGSIESRQAMEDSTRVTVRLRAGDATTATLIVYDSFGNELLARRKVHLGVRPVSSISPSVEPLDSAGGVAWYRRPSIWLGVSAVAAGGVTVALGLSARAAEADRDAILANSSAHTFPEARDAEDRAKARARYTNIAIATTGVLSLAALASLLFIDPSARSRGTQGSLVLTGEGAQAVIKGSF